MSEFMELRLIKLVYLVTLLLFLLSFLELTALIPPSQNDSHKSQISLILEIQEANSKLAQLEYECEAKSSRIRELEAKIEELNTVMHRPRFSEDETSSVNANVHVLEEEVQLLWTTSRKNNFEIHKLETRAQDAESKLNEVISQFEEMDEVVSHQWIQIQQLEQAVQMAQLRTASLKRQLSSSRCSFLKFIKNSAVEHLERTVEILKPYVCDGDSILKSGIAEAMRRLKSTFAAAKQFHHQLQAYIQRSLRRNEFTAVLAHEEVVFFMASAVITFPVLSLFKLVFSHFS